MWPRATRWSRSPWLTAEPVTTTEPAVPNELADEPTTEVPATASGENRSIRRLGLGTAAGAVRLGP